MTKERTFTAILLNADGTVLDEQEHNTLQGAPVSPTHWSTIGLDGMPIATYDATLTDNPHPGQGDDHVYYRAANRRTLTGPNGAPTINQHHDATPYEETKYTAVLAPEDGETQEFWFGNLPTTNGLIPEHITVLAVSRTTVYLYKRSHLVAPDRAVFTRYGHDLLNGPLPHDQDDQYDIVLRG